MVHVLITPVLALPKISQIYSDTSSPAWPLLGKPTPRAGGVLTSWEGCNPVPGFQILGLQRPRGSRSLNNDPRASRRKQSKLICWSCTLALLPCRGLASSTRPPVLQLITGLGSRMGQMSTRGALPGNKRLPGLAGSCHCPYSKLLLLLLLLLAGHVQVRVPYCWYPGPLGNAGCEMGASLCKAPEQASPWPSLANVWHALPLPCSPTNSMTAQAEPTQPFQKHGPG